MRGRGKGVMEGWKGEGKREWSDVKRVEIRRWGMEW